MVHGKKRLADIRHTY